MSVAIALAALTAPAEAEPPRDREPPLTVREMRPLDFGTVISGGPATISMDPRSPERRMRGASAAPGDRFQLAEFRITGRPHAEIRVTFPNTIELADGALITRLRHNGPRHLRLDNRGELTLLVGGELALSQRPPHGPLSTEIDIEVEYLWDEEDERRSRSPS